MLNEIPVHKIPTKQAARTIGLLTQSPIAPEGMTVTDLVGRGRHPHRSLFSRWNAEDDRAWCHRPIRFQSGVSLP